MYFSSFVPLAKTSNFVILTVAIGRLV